MSDAVSAQSENLELNRKFPCPGGFRGRITEWKFNKLCGQRHKKNVAIYECEKFARECSIEPYASGQPELCCKRCDVFWQTDKLKIHQLGVAIKSFEVVNGAWFPLRRDKELLGKTDPFR